MRRKSWLLAAVVVVLATCGIALGVVKSANSTVFCENVTIATSSDTQQSPNMPYAGVGEVLTASTDGTSCFGFQISTYQWRDNGVNISGATSSTYTVQPTDTGDVITVKVTDTHGDNQVSPTGVTAVGASKLIDDFNGAANSQPCTAVVLPACPAALWSYDSGTSGGITYSGDGTYMGETGSGSLEIQAINSSGVWNSSALTAKSTYSGARYVEVRMEPVCYSGSLADFVAYDATGGSGANLESDLNEQYSTTANYDLHQSAVHYWNSGSGYHTYHAQTSGWGYNEGVQLCGNYHTFGELVTSSSIKFYYDGQQMLSSPGNPYVASTSDCAFSDPDGNTEAESSSPNNLGGDGDCGTDPSPVTDFTTFAQYMHLAIIGFDDAATCPTDESDGVSDPDDSCVSDPTDSDGSSDDITGSGPIGMFIDYVHVYSQS